MITFSLNTFIKICLLDTGGRISEIQKRLTGSGGYDFYKPFQNAVRAHCDGNAAKAENLIQAPSNDAERKHNSAAYDEFKSRFGSTKSLSSLKNTKKLRFPTAGIEISVDPLFELSKSGVRQTYSVWVAQNPQLTQRYGALACYVMRQAFANSNLANSSFFYADIVQGKTYSEKQITNNTSLILAADVNSLGTLVKEL